MTKDDILEHKLMTKEEINEMLKNIHSHLSGKSIRTENIFYLKEPIEFIFGKDKKIYNTDKIVIDDLGEEINIKLYLENKMIKWYSIFDKEEFEKTLKEGEK